MGLGLIPPGVRVASPLRVASLFPAPLSIMEDALLVARSGDVESISTFLDLNPECLNAKVSLR